MAETTTLWCEAGRHDWQREKKRGAKPKNCPQHQPVVVTLDPEERIRRQQEGRRKKQEAKDKIGVQQVIDYRAWVKADAVVWAAYRSGELTQEQYKDQKPRMPEVPDNSAYDAARRAGIVTSAPVEDDDGDE